jgi:hypothetical protein
MTLLADDDVVVHRDAERLGYLHDRLRHLHVGFGVADANALPLAYISAAHCFHSIKTEGVIGRSTMNLFAFVAGMMAVIHLVAGWQRPRLAVIVSAILWLLYAVYEHLVASGVLCDANCNIRVDLVFFIPILGLATFCAYRSYMGQPGQMKVIGTVLGVIGLLVVALVVESYGYGNLAFVGFIVGVLAIGFYAIKSRSITNRT